MKQLRDLLRVVGRQIDRLGALAGGLGGTYRWCRQAMTAAYDRGTGADFREWRKAVRYHGYQVRLLADLWPHELGGRREVLDRLARLLDEHHDLAELAGTGTDENLAVQVEQRQQALRAMARPLARRLFAAPPATFRRELLDFWRGWRQTDPQAAAA